MVTGNCLLLRLAESSSDKGKPGVCLVLYTSRVAFIAGRMDILRAQVNQISEERNCLEEQREEGSSFTPENVTHPERGAADRRPLTLRARTSVPRHILSVGNLFTQNNPQH
jgi:hypothetical protein